MNRTEFNQLGGFPLSTNILDEMQNAYALFNAMAHLAGPLAIVSGCEAQGSTLLSGVVALNGEVLEFRGGPLAPTVQLIEEEVRRPFEDGVLRTVLVRRYITPGASTPDRTWNWADFKRVFPPTSYPRSIDPGGPDKALEEKPSDIPLGLVAIWDRPASAIPANWVEHLPLQGRVPVGQSDPAELGTFSQLGENLGEERVTLTALQIPPHTHGYQDIYHAERGGNVAVGGSLGSASSDNDNAGYQMARTSEPNVGGQAHNNIQPSRVVKYIRFDPEQYQLNQQNAQYNGS